MTSTPECLCYDSFVCVISVQGSSIGGYALIVNTVNTDVILNVQKDNGSFYYGVVLYSSMLIQQQNQNKFSLVCTVVELKAAFRLVHTVTGVSVQYR